MDDLFLRTIVRSYTDNPRFIRRDWLAADLEQRLADPGCRFVLITAEPGAGKSAFVAQLAADHADWPVYFIRRDQRTTFEGGGGRSFLLRVGFELAALHPELFALDQVRVEIEQRVGQVQDGGAVVGAEITRLVASPFHQTILKVTQEIQSAGGSVAGIRVDEWVAAPRLIGLDDLQNLALLDPARAYARLHPGERIVILIDALDELRYHPDEHGLIEWLSNLPELPENIRFVMTSRPADAALRELRAKHAPSLRELTISTTDRRVLEDIHAYVARLLEPTPIADALVEAGRDKASFADELALKADGNIGYLDALGRAFDRASADSEHRKLLVELFGLRKLPDDTNGLYELFLSQIKVVADNVNVKVTDPTTGRSLVFAAWPEVFHPILGVLSVCLEPVTLEQIQSLSGTLADRAFVINALQWLEQFLDRIGNTYRLYHTTLAEFLTSAETRDNPETIDFYVELEKEHRRIGAVLDGDGSYESLWTDSDDRVEQGRREYARRQLVRHLDLGRDWARLYRVIDQGAYAKGKLESDPSTFSFSLDMDVAIGAAGRADRSEEIMLRDLPRLWRYKLLRVSLSSYADDLAPTTYEAMTLLDGSKQATELAELITQPERQSLAFGRIAAIAAQDPNESEAANALMRRAYDVAERVVNQDTRRAALRELLDLCFFILNVAPRLELPVREGAGRVARGLDDPVARVEALATIARWLHVANDADGARALREEVATASHDGDPSSATPLLSTYIELSAQLGEFSAARKAAAEIDDAGARIVELIAIARAERRAASGDPAAALAEATTLAQQLTGAAAGRAKLRLAQYHLEFDEPELASRDLGESIAAVHAGGSRDADTLADLAATLRRAGEIERSAEVVRLLHGTAVDDLAARPSGTGQGYSFSPTANRAGTALASLDERDLALDVASRMDASSRYDTLTAVVESCVRGARWDEALAAVDRMRAARQESPVSLTTGPSSAIGYDTVTEALIDIANGLATSGEWTRAVDIAGQVSGPGRVKALSDVALLRLAADQRDAAAELVQRVLLEVRLASSRDDRTAALKTMTTLLVLGQQWPAARQVAAAIEPASERSAAVAQIAHALIDAGQIADAETAIGDIDDSLARAYALVALSARVRAARAAGVAPTDDGYHVANLLKEAHDLTVGSHDGASRAAALRAIAIAMAEIGDAHLAADTMIESVQALNAAAHFGFRPTPWCDTCVAFATIGDWDRVTTITSGLVKFDPFDGCSALRDVAALARERRDLERAEAHLAEARRHAPEISFPPMRDDLLASLAEQYARLGKIDEAMKDDLVTPATRNDALDRIAAALADLGRVDEALAVQGQIAPPEHARRATPALVSAYLAAGSVDLAYSAAASISPSDRGPMLVRIAAAAFDARAARAQPIVDEALALARAAGTATFVQQLVDLFEHRGQRGAAIGLVEDQWVAVSTRGELLSQTSIAGPLVPAIADLGRQLADGLDWVDKVLSDR